MDVPFLDLTRHHAPLRDEVLAAWAEIYDSSAFVGGERVAAFEEAFAGAHDVRHVIAVGNGTEALELILRGLGIGTGDGVVVPVSTFIATAEAVSNVGASPVFVDCTSGGSIDVDQAVAAMERPSVRAVLPVHLYGQPADLDPLIGAAERSGIAVVEDAAQAHLATYKDRKVGGLGVAAGFSFYPGKNLGAPGEGGAITTNDDALAERLRMMRDHGQSAKYRSEIVGTNARMMELVAAVLRVKLPCLAGYTQLRRRVAAAYGELLGGDERIDLPVATPWADPVYHLYVVEVDRRDEVRRLLASRGVATGLHYPVPLHLQPAYRDAGHRPGDFPVAERRARRLLSLPMFPELTDAEMEAVAKGLRDSVDEAYA
jgi:dTDP-4-amino-4,6-dideoxygalactose transaminase